MEDLMQKTSISFKAFIVALAVTGASFTSHAGGVVADLNQRTAEMTATLEEMRKNFNNQQDNTGPTQLDGRYKKRFDNQLSQLEALVKKAVTLLNTSGGRSSGRPSIRNTGEDLRIAPLLTNLVANLDRNGIILDPDTMAELITFFEGINTGSDQKLANQINAALGTLRKRSGN